MESFIEVLNSKSKNSEVESLRLIVGTIVEKFVDLATDISLNSESIEEITKKLDILQKRIDHLEIKSRPLSKPVIPKPPPPPPKITQKVVEKKAVNTRQSIMEELNDMFKRRKT